MSKKSSAARKSRVATSFQVQFEPLEGRRYFSAVVQQFSFPTASAGAAVAPFIQDNLGSNPHGEQLVATAISPVDGTLAVLVQVQSFDGPTPPTATSLTLYEFERWRGLV